LLEEFERHGLIYKLGSDNPKVKEILDMISGRFAYTLALRACDHYIDTAEGDVVAEIARELRKLLDRYGGEEAVHAFLEMEREFADDDGLTRYSLSYFEGKPRIMDAERAKLLVGTEAFASIADYINLVKRLASEDEKMRELVDKYWKTPHKLLDKEIYQRAMEFELARARLGGFRAWDKGVERKLKLAAKFLRLAKGVFRK
jgi:hypothetical protein